ncbi:MAG: hypothetical protein JWN93_3046 [Hyphomicrobiales bacterium]|nr:hypothetical protein [Hyphomicrobiales bacterium]
MQMIHAADLAWSEKEERHREGSLAFKNLFHGQEGDPNNFRLVLSRNGGEYRSPLHRHNFDQVRYCVKGAANIAPGKTLEEGDVGYFPEGTRYGPQFDQGGQRVTLVLQCGGASRQGYMSAAQLRRGLEELEAVGTFAGGKFQRHGEDAARDSYEAIWEHIFQRPMLYPAPRYEDPLLIRPAGFEWRVDAGAPGVKRKPLGSFTERGVRLELIALDPGAQATLGEPGALCLAFVQEGEGASPAGDWRAHTAMRLDDETLQVTARAAAHALVVTLPLISRS